MLRDRARSPRWLAAAAALAAACGARATALGPPAGVQLEVAVVPGCPTAPDGRLSTCQWRRAIWAAHLVHTGVVRRIVASGGAAHTPFVEAEALAAGMEALGVPRSAILLETQALHTDQNAGYSLAIIEQLGLAGVAMASEPGHADGMCSMAARWGWPCTPLPIDEAVVAARLAEPLPDVRLEPIPRDRWIAEHREPRMATSDRYSSFWYYTGVILESLVTGSRPPVPPRPEPTRPAGGRSEVASP